MELTKEVIEQVISRTEELLDKVTNRHEQCSRTISLLNQLDMNGMALTVNLLELVPDIAELSLPVLSEKESENLIAFSFYNRSNMKMLLENLKNDPKDSLLNYAAELCAKLQILHNLQEETLRVMFMNRFAIQKCLSHLTEYAPENMKTVIETIKEAMMILNISTVYIELAQDFEQDMKFIKGTL